MSLVRQSPAHRDAAQVEASLRGWTGFMEILEGQLLRTGAMSPARPSAWPTSPSACRSTAGTRRRSSIRRCQRCAPITSASAPVPASSPTAATAYPERGARLLAERLVQALRQGGGVGAGGIQQQVVVVGLGHRGDAVLQDALDHLLAGRHAEGATQDSTPLSGSFSRIATSRNALSLNSGERSVIAPWRKIRISWSFTSGEAQASASFFAQALNSSAAPNTASTGSFIIPSGVGW